MRHSARISGLGLTVLLASGAHAIEIGSYEIALQADVRWVHVDSPLAAFNENGLGLSRFDEDHDGLRLGRALANFVGPITETLRADLTLSGTGDSDVNAFDVTEAFIEWRPYPSNRLRWRSRAGAFYPPVSLENRAIGWQSPYSISASAINTWLGEEVRAIGVEQTVTLSNAPLERRYDLSLVGGLYRLNDPMGVLLFQRGWAIHDRQTALFDEVPRPFPRLPHESTINFFREIDQRTGFYLGADYKLERRFQVRAMRYDNRGDPAIRGYKDTAWLTRFNALGMRYELPTGTTLMVQWMDGDTSVGPSNDGRGMLIADFNSYFTLISQEYRQHRFTARYDRMQVDSTRGAEVFQSKQNAASWTLAYLWTPSESWQLALEQVELRGSLAQRGRQGQNPYARERTLQVAVRYSL